MPSPASRKPVSFVAVCSEILLAVAALTTRRTAAIAARMTFLDILARFGRHVPHPCHGLETERHLRTASITYWPPSGSQTRGASSHRQTAPRRGRECSGSGWSSASARPNVAHPVVCRAYRAESPEHHVVCRANRRGFSGTPCGLSCKPPRFLRNTMWSVLQTSKVSREHHVVCPANLQGFSGTPCGLSCEPPRFLRNTMWSVLRTSKVSPEHHVVCP